MSQWTPEWTVTINGGGNYTNLTLSDLSITSGRSDIYSQPYAGYCRVSIINLDQSPIVMDINDQISIQVKDSAGAAVNLFGGYISDIDVSVVNTGTNGVNQIITVTALGALSKLPKTLTDGVLSKDYEGNQIYSILSQALFNTWNEVPPAETWAGYNPATTWANAENVGLGEIDQPGDYELTARSAEVIDMYSLVASLANSGLGYLYEDNQGRIGYADSTRRNTYLTANGYEMLSGGQALASAIKTSKKAGDIRNNVTITYKNNAQVTVEDASSIAYYGQQAANISTTLEHTADATYQANFYLGIRAYPQAQFKTITFPLGNGNINDTDRDLLLNVFMGLPLDITDLPSNLEYGRFQGFVEGWTFQSTYNNLNITLNLSPTAFSLQAARWNGVSAAETWNTLSATMTWNTATIVA